MTDSDFLYLINQFFEMKQKSKAREVSFLDRNFGRLDDKLDEMGFTIVNPLGEKYSETRTDVSAHIASEKVQNLKISEVIKPIVYKSTDGKLELIQQGNVIVE